MGGGVKISKSGWHRLSYTQRTSLGDNEVGREKVRSLQEQYGLKDPRMMEHKLELGDNVTNAIQTVFPSLVVQQILNALAVRQILPKGVDRTELVWTVLGFEDDDEEMKELRLKVNKSRARRKLQQPDATPRGVSLTSIVRVLAPLAFVAPRVIAAIADGGVAGSATVTGLAQRLPDSWAEQERRPVRAVILPLNENDDEPS